MKQERIPKIIHYCWFGDTEMPSEIANNIDNWKETNPTFEVRKWDESSFDISHNYYTQKMYEQKKWAFLSDYVRLYALRKFGGFYFDTDVTFLKPIDESLISCGNFVSQEDIDLIATGLGCGAQKNAKWVISLMENYDSFSPKNNYIENRTCVELTTKYFNKLGFSKNKEKIILIDGISIFPTRYFCPQLPGTKKAIANNETYTWHHYNYSWQEGKNNVKLIFIKNKIRHIIVCVFGEKVYQRARELYRKRIRGI